MGHRARNASKIVSQVHPMATVLVMEPSDAFYCILSELCAWSTAVTIERRTGGPVDAVLLACGRSAVIYEHWSDAMGTPTGDLGVVGFEEIEAVRVPF
jgi:hypothetical protein